MSTKESMDFNGAGIFFFFIQLSNSSAVAVTGKSLAEKDEAAHSRSLQQKRTSLSVRFQRQSSRGAHLNMPINKCQHISPAQQKIFVWRHWVAPMWTVTCRDLTAAVTAVLF